MIAIGIDQSLRSTGVVIIEDTKLLYVNTIQPALALDTFDCAIYISQTISEIINNLNKPIDHIAIEGLSFNSPGKYKSTLAGIQCLIITTLRQLKLPVIIIPPTTVKKFATGMGNATKNDMIKQLPDHVVKQFSDHRFKVNKTANGIVRRSKGFSDITDAYWLSQYVMLGNT